MSFGWHRLQVMCSEHLQERKELIQALHKDRKLSDLPKINHVILLYIQVINLIKWLFRFSGVFKGLISS